jgi:hypothetical protein
MNILVNGKTINLPESLTPLSNGENLLVPLKPFMRSAGANAVWNNETKSVEIKTRGKLLSIPLDGSPARLDGVILDTSAQIYARNGASFASINFLKEVLGFDAEVDYMPHFKNIKR